MLCNVCILPRNIRSAFHFAVQKAKVMFIKRYFLFCSTFASFLALVDFAQSSLYDDDNEMNRQSKGMTTLS